MTFRDVPFDFIMIACTQFKDSGKFTCHTKFIAYTTIMRNTLSHSEFKCNPKSESPAWQK